MAQITDITLSSLFFFEGKSSDASGNDSLRLDGFMLDKDVNGKKIHVTLDFQLTSLKISLLSFRYYLTYSYTDEEDASHLKAAVILAHAVPYVRELIANITMRSSGKPICLSTINTNNLYKDFLDRERQQAEQQQAEQNQPNIR